MSHVRAGASYASCLVAVALVAVVLPPTGTSSHGAPARSALVTRTTQLVADPGFERTDVRPCFRTAPGSTSTVERTTKNPLQGLRSVRADLSGGDSVSCRYSFGASTPEAVRIDGELDLADRSLRGSVSACLVVRLAGDGTDLSECAIVAAGSRVPLELSVAVAEQVSSMRWVVTADDRPARLWLDEAHLLLTTDAETCDPVTEPVPSGPPDPDSPCDDTAAPPVSSYEPAALDLPATRPFLPLDDYTTAPADDPVAEKFRQYVDRAVAGEPDWGYTPADAVVQFARTGSQEYLSSAIEDVDRQVTRAERAIAKGQQPFIAGDSYLEVGPEIEALALTYDWGFSELTRKQRIRWRRFGDQAVANVWSPQTASWGGRRAGSSAWSGWSINNPGNNYNFSFVQATQLWALATRQTAWTEFLQEHKFPLITAYYEQVPGGGSREGTGYGTAQTRLWANARTWAGATGEHLTAVEDHARESVDYWVHATVPTLDFFAPFGDLSRESVPNLYDYQENLVREAAMAAPGPEADRALWWIQHNSVPDDMDNSFNLRGALLRPDGTATKPTALVHEAPGVGQLFARTAWQPEATWLSVIAGPFDESHAHMEQGAFSLYDGTWQSVTSNIWSHSGIQGGGHSDDDAGTGISSIVRFDGPDGPVPQDYSTSTLATTSTPEGVEVHADLSPAYAGSEGLVTTWERDLVFAAGDLDVTDTCVVDGSVTPIWQLHVPTQPTDHGDGTVTVGALTLSFDPGYAVGLVRMSDVAEDFTKGWRIELANAAGCGFEVAIDVS